MMHIWLSLDIVTPCHVQPLSGLVDVMDMVRRFHLRRMLFIPFGDGVVPIFHFFSKNHITDNF